jgi:hypothetical protein
MSREMLPRNPDSSKTSQIPEPSMLLWESSARVREKYSTA